MRNEMEGVEICDAGKHANDLVNPVLRSVENDYVHIRSKTSEQLLVILHARIDEHE